MGALVLKGGYSFTDYLGVEARYSVGMQDDSYDVSSIKVKNEIDAIYGAYLIASLPNETMFKPYIALGYSKAEVNAEATFLSGPDTYTTVKGSLSETGISYGVGLNVNFTENFSGNVEYASLVDEGELTVDGFSLGLAYRF